MKNLFRKIWQSIVGKPEIEPKPVLPKRKYRVLKVKETKKKGWKVGRCHITDKFMFTKEQAQEKQIELKRVCPDKYLRTFLCQFCGKWHLTHKKQ